MPRQKLPSNREAVILGILINGEKYGREIRDEYQKRAQEMMPLGSLYTTLLRMKDKGFVRRRWGESAPERGGNRRRYFRITASGQAALDAAEVRLLAIRGVLRDA